MMKRTNTDIRNAFALEEKDGIILTDVFSTYRDGRQIGESAMIVIDSDTGKYEKIEVPGELKYKVFSEK
ncbi:MAG: hypothetical protein HDQ96_03210 [Lachnospiraceae bacterium]|nr:hypothetical protein [Lachnospiraceae bacterium]